MEVIRLLVKLWCDNNVASYIANNLVFYEWTKHIKVGCYFVREKVHEGLISTSCILGDEQLEDLFTKGLGRNQVEYICNKLA